MRMHNRHDEQLNRGTDAAMSALYKFLDAKNHFVNAAESAGLQVKHEARERLLRSRRTLHRGRQNLKHLDLKHLGEDAVRHTRRRPLALVGVTVIAGLFLYQVFVRKQE